MLTMYSILAIDAAWTPGEPSGISLVRRLNEEWVCVALAPSYEQFYLLSEGQSVDWAMKPKGSYPDIPKLLESCRKFLEGQLPSIITIDMPVSLQPITSRREADTKISREFGARKCSTHSPTKTRPGKISSTYTQECRKYGYEVATSETRVGTINRLIEVYPHTALLYLMHADERVKYKVSKSNKFWPKTAPEYRKTKVLAIFNEIRRQLDNKIQNITLPLNNDLLNMPLNALKRYEDAIDALVCAWTGIYYIDQYAIPYGDESAAIWVPIRKPG